MGRIAAKRALTIAVLLSVAASCSSTPKVPKSVVASTIGASTSPSATGPTEEERAQAIALTDSDFPSGWSGTPHADDPTEKDFERRIKACSGVTVNTGASTDIFGDDFDSGPASAGSEVEFFKTAALVRADMATIDNSRVVSCVRNLLVQELKAALEQQGAQGVTVRSISFGKVAVSRYADASAALRLTATVSASGRTFRFYQDVVVIQKGRLEVAVSFFNIGQLFPSALARALLTKVAARMIKDGGR